MTSTSAACSAVASGDGDSTGVLLNKIADGVCDGERADGRHERVGLPPVEHADRRSDLAVSLFPEAAAMAEHRELACESGVGGERRVGAGVGMVGEDAYLVTGPAVIKPVERKVSPGKFWLISPGWQLDLEGNSHASHPPTSVLDENEA